MIKVQPFFSYCIALLTPMMALGCATLIEGSTQDVTFISEPSGAQIVVDGTPMGVTPAVITLKKPLADNTNVVFKKDGYQDQEVILHRKVTGWFWGNIIFGLWGLLGSSTDAMSGSQWEYSQNTYVVTLPPTGASSGEMARWDSDNKLRRFILYSHEHLAADLARGGGESLSSLCALLDLNKAQQEAAILELRMIATSAGDAPAFATAVLRKFRNR